MCRIDDKNIRKLRELVDRILMASTKASAKPFIQTLEQERWALRDSLDPYIWGKLGEVISYAKEASGQVREKEHWIRQVEKCWYVFQGGARKSESG